MRFRRALDAEPGLAAAHAGLADAYAAAGEIKPAITEMERAARSDPDGSWHYRLANWYREAGRAENARAAFAETARIKSELLARQQARFFELNSPNRADRSPTVAAR
jgi:predicted Zn-dependent protease